MIAGLGVIGGAALIVYGLVVGLAGFRIFRLFLSLSLFIVGFFIGQAIGVQNNAGETGALLIGILVGFVFSGVGWALYRFGILLAGGIVGGVLAFLVTSSVAGLDSTTSIVIIVVAIVIGALLAIAANKWLVIVATAIAGAAGIVIGAAALLPDLGLVSESIAAGGTTEISLSLGGWLAFVVLALIGVSSQAASSRGWRRRPGF